jgi:capsular exopolysaccharide synthesis family protein
MSRIDQALRAWEKRATPAATPERFELGGYGHESANGHRESTPQVQESEAVAPGFRIPPAPASTATASSNGNGAGHGTGRPVTGGHLSADLEARLVTGGSGAVPLEQYRRLAAVLHDIQSQQGLRTLMLTSALPAEGKTLTTVNLALTLSESYGRRVLVIDADLRWPSVHKAFGLANDVGLSEALYGDGRELAITHLSPRLAVLTAGHPGVTPLAGLTSVRMSQLLDACAAQFDWVLLDTPPVGLLPDAQVLARLTRAAVFVIAAGVTPSATVARAIAELGSDSVIGTVLNRVEDRRIPQSDYYSRYGYGYGENRD